MKTLCKQVFGGRIICADQCKSTYPFAHLQKYLHRGCFSWIGKNVKKLKRAMFQQSAANLSFFAYRLHNEMLDKKINSTHDCQDYIKLFNFWESKFQVLEISPLPRTALACFEKRMAIIIQPLCKLAHARSHSRRSNLVTHAIGQERKIFSITFTANFRFKLAIWWAWHETSDYLGGAPSKWFATLWNDPKLCLILIASRRWARFLIGRLALIRVGD